MNLLPTLACAAVLLFGGSPQRQPVRLKVGDVVAVECLDKEYSGDYAVLSDGAIYGHGFGRLLVEGKTWDQVQPLVRRSMSKFVRPESVFVTIHSERPDVVYLVGMGSGKGPTPLTPDLDLRQLLSSATLGEDTDEVDAKLFRDGKLVHSYNVREVLRDDDPANSVKLQPSDVISISPSAFVRVWVLGMVVKAGEVRLPDGSDVYRALSAAGGIRPAAAGDTETSMVDAHLVIRRGQETIVAPLSPPPGAKPVPLEANDTVSVEGPELKRITVAGEVRKPGEFIARGDAGIVNAISLAGGVADDGTLRRVLVFRKGEMLQVDASGPIAGQGQPNLSVQSGDVIYVRKNENSIYVLGEVNSPKRILMEDHRVYRVSDALSLGGGLSGRGTLRRVYLSRPGPDGRGIITEFNLDEYLKDGKDSANPVLEPGDAVLFGQPKGLTLGSVGQALSSFVFLDTLVRRP